MDFAGRGRTGSPEAPGHRALHQGPVPMVEEDDDEEGLGLNIDDNRSETTETDNEATLIDSTHLKHRVSTWRRMLLTHSTICEDSLLTYISQNLLIRYGIRLPGLEMSHISGWTVVIMNAAVLR